MALNGGDLGAMLRLLAETLLRQVEQIGERSVARMQELLPAYARVPREELMPVTLATIAHLLEAIRDPAADRPGARDGYWATGVMRARQGIASDEMLHAWRIVLQEVRQAGYATAEELDIGQEALLEFVEATLRSGDVGMRTSTAAHHETEIREIRRLVDEQAALRRVATLVARGASSETLLAAVAQQVAGLLRVPLVMVVRFEPDETATECARCSEGGTLRPPGARWSLEGTNVPAAVRATGRPARIGDHAGLMGEIAETWRREGIRSALGVPIIVDGRLWGAIVACSEEAEPLPADTESRLADFCELVAMAISNANARLEVERLADEQTALWRVTMLVARGSSPDQSFAKVVEDVGRLLGVELAVVQRYEPDGEATVVARWSELRTDAFAVGDRWKPAPDSITAVVRRTQRPARGGFGADSSAAITATARKDGVRSAIATPIVVDGLLWGTISAGTTRTEPMRADAESRIAQFAELVATAISNVQARVEAQRLADEQAALRRVAMLVAGEASPEDVFVKVAEEVGPLLGAETGSIDRFEADGYCTVVGSWGKLREAFEVGSRWKLEGASASVAVYRAERPVRLDYDEHRSGPISAQARGVGLRSAIGSPIVVDGRLWGALVVATSQPEPFPAEAEARIAQFAELVATSIANVQARSDLAASQARIVVAADEERRRVVRDLHDGAQQRLVYTVVTLKLAQRAQERGGSDASALVREALEHAQRATDELRELAHGILPAVLTRSGLRAGVDQLASRMSIPVEVSVTLDRLSAPVEATAYFVVAEALTNVAKYANASCATVSARVVNRSLELEVSDDGVGGVQLDGTGLVGLRDRVGVFGGALRVHSPTGGGTVIAASIPVGQATTDGNAAPPRANVPPGAPS